MESEGAERLRRGLSNLRMGALLSLIAYATMPILLLTILLFLVILLTVALAAAVITYLMALCFFLRSIGHLRSFDAKLGMGRTGVMLQLAGFIVMVIGLLVLASTPIPSGPHPVPGGGMTMEEEISRTFARLKGVVLTGVIISLAGGLLFGRMLMGLGRVEGLDGFRTAAILYAVAFMLSAISFVLALFIEGPPYFPIPALISLATPFIFSAAVVINIVAMILIYTCSGRGLRSIESSRSAPPAIGQSQPAGSP